MAWTREVLDEVISAEFAAARFAVRQLPCSFHIIVYLQSSSAYYLYHSWNLRVMAKLN